MNADFESLWRRDVPALGPPNRRGSGVSSVGVIDATQWPELGATGRVYVKRQQAFFCRPPWNAFRRTPTARRELRFIRIARRLGVAAPNVVHYAEGPGDRALLVTAEISGVVDLERAVDALAGPERAVVFEHVGAALALLHSSRILHGAVYAKHLLVGRAAGRVWIIDFEKARRVRSRASAAERDLSRLIRHSTFMTAGDLTALLSRYDPRLFPGLHRRLAARRR